MRNKLFPIDWWLLIPVFFLITISLTVLFSINIAYFENQVVALVLSLIVFFFFSQFSYKDLRIFSVPIYILAIVLLLIVLVLGIEARGAARWITIFGFSVQVSETFKPLLSVTFADYLAKHSKRSIRSYLTILGAATPIFLLVHLQPDLGNALIYVGTVLFVLILYGIPYVWLGLTALPFLFASPFIWNSLHDYQRRRILTFISPMEDPQGSSYNLTQAVIAVGSGMLLGKGIGEGTQSRLRFLPENHTDFIFASLAEKLGFLGTIIVIVAFIVLLWRILIIFRSSKDDFGKFYAASSFFFIIIHFFVNVGMNLGIVPVVGVTLPFISYGGSSLMANFITLGILSSVSVNNRKKEVLQIR